MIELKESDYTILNNKKWFYVREKFNLQCAYCLFLQSIEFERNKQGLIIGVYIKPENECHSPNCKQGL